MKVKSIKSVDNLPKYSASEYVRVENGIYKCDDEYVTCLSFEQEPEFAEGYNAADISEYPLEDILDKFYVYVSDYLQDMNTEDSEVCYLEFAGSDLEAIRSLRTIIGKHVYNKERAVNGKCYVEFVIEKG